MLYSFGVLNLVVPNNVYLPLLLQKSIQPFLKEISKILIEVVFVTLSLSKTGLITVLMIPFAPLHCGLSLLRN